jgi:hypothetical protein
MYAKSAERAGRASKFAAVQLMRIGRTAKIFSRAARGENN